MSNPIPRELPQTQALPNKQHFTFSKGNMMRKGTRLIILIILLFVIALLIFIWASLYSHNKGIYPAHLLVSISLSNCQLIFTEDNSIPTQKLFIAGKVPQPKNSLLITKEDTALQIYANNTANSIDVCYIQLSISNTTQLSGGVKISCIGICSIIQKGPAILDFNEGDIYIDGQSISTNFQTVKANRIMISSLKGDVYIHNAHVGKSASLSTENGDIVYQSTKPYKINVESSNKYYCIGANNYVVEEDDNCKAIDSSPPCKFSLILCKVNECELTNYPTVSLNGKNGNIYSNLIDKDNVPIGDAGGSYKIYKLATKNFDKSETPYNEGFSFDSDTLIDFENALVEYNMTARSDSVILLNLGNNACKAASALKLLIAPSRAYLLAAPWWMSFLSISLLIGNPIILNYKLLPGQCPYKPYLDAYSINSILNFVVNFTSTQVNNIQYGGFLDNDINNEISNQLEMGTGYKMGKSNSKVYGINKMKDRNYISYPLSITQNPSLAAAIVISVILAVVVGIIGIFTLIVSLKYYLDAIGDESEHIEKYVRTEIANNNWRYFTQNEIDQFFEDNDPKSKEQDDLNESN